MEDTFLKVLVGLVVPLLALYYYLTSNFDFWKIRNVAGPKPIPLLGNYKDFIFGKANPALLMTRFYNEFKNEPIIGIYLKSNPALILRSADLIKDVLIKDFHVFSERGIFSSKKDLISHTLVTLEYARWRPLRNKLSPVFTFAKLKEMVHLIADCADHFEKYIEKTAEKSNILEFRELSAKFTTQVIGVCVFGLNTNTISDKDSEFRRFGRAVFESSFGNIVRRILRDFAPFLFELLGSLKFNSRMGFFVKSMTEMMTYRRKNKVRRNDFMDLLLELQDQPEQMGNMDVNDRFLIGQAVVFFATGFETSALTISNVFYEVALNQDIQGKLRQDIETQLEKNDRKLTYDCIKSMTYLDKVIKETLRKYPPGSIIQRKATSEYTFSEQKVTIPKDTKVLIPVWAIHHDPEIFPDPEKFDPERFNEENEKMRHPMNYLPFGEGPHNCIGYPFGICQTKIGVIAVIKKFQLEVCEKTDIPYRINPRAAVSTPINGIHLKITKL